MINQIVKTIELPDGRTITLETGKLAKQADGSVMPVSYTHLDVYKRQPLYWRSDSRRGYDRKPTQCRGLYSCVSAPVESVRV